MTASEVAVTGVQHRFGDAVALHGVDLTVTGGEFRTLLGPSGSGKTTLLRIISGLVQPTAGTVSIDGRDVTRVPAQRRDIGLVFQNYALFPHLTVEQNIGYPLKIRRVDRAARQARVGEMLELVSLTGFERRRPGELSGGQQQRVALARALAHGPKVLLLDEPLGALDRRLRQQVGADLRRIQQETGITAIYVTHDQEEAFLLSDRIAVMRDGNVVQNGAPGDVYARPQDLFVAQFLGEANVLRGTVDAVRADRADVRFGEHVVECTHADPAPAAGQEAIVVIRPERLDVRPSDGEARDPAWASVGDGRVVDRMFLGGVNRIRVEVGGATLLADLGAEQDVPDVGDVVRVQCRRGAPMVLSTTSKSEE